MVWFLLVLLSFSALSQEYTIEHNDNEMDFMGRVIEKRFEDRDYFKVEMARFRAFQQSVFSGQNSDAKYLIYYPVHTGMGNRIEGLVSTFLLAYLTDRAFFVNWDYTDPVTKLPRIKMVEDEVLDEPFPWHIKYLERQFSSDFIEKNSIEIELRGGKSTYQSVPFIEKMCCENIEKNLKEKFVFIKGNKYFAQLLAANPHYEQKFSQLFGPGVQRNMLAPLLGFLVKPKKIVLDEVKAFVSQFRGKRLVGIQMRTTEKYSTKSGLQIYEHCPQLLADENTIFFVSTDDVRVRGNLIERYGEDRVVYYSDYIDMHKSQGRYRTSVFHAMKDVLTLGYCDEMVITCGSSFSRVAVGLARRPAVIASAGGNYCRWHNEKTCTKALSLESCAYHWFENNLKKCSCYNEEIDFRESAICGANM